MAPSWRELPRARLGPILLFSLTAGVVFSFVAARWGYWPAALAAGSWVLQPNLFGHGHYAAYDAVLSSLWVLPSLRLSGRSTPQRGRCGAGKPLARRDVFGVILGCAAGTKLTGWFLPLPFLGWVVLYRSRQGFVTLAGWCDDCRGRAVHAICLRGGASRWSDYSVSGFQPEPR